YKLFQIDVERRLKNPDSDGAGFDSAMDIRQKVVGIVERKSDAIAIEIRPQAAPIAGQVGLGDFARFARPLHLRQGRRSEIIGCRTDQGKRGKSERPSPSTDDHTIASPR